MVSIRPLGTKLSDVIIASKVNVFENVVYEFQPLCWGLNMLTHWPLGDLDAILKLQFPISFYWLVSSHCLMIMPWDECHGTLLMMSQHWFRYWLGAVRQQAITWTNVDIVPCRHMASPGHNELTLVRRSQMWREYYVVESRMSCFIVKNTALKMLLFKFFNIASSTRQFRRLSTVKPCFIRVEGTLLLKIVIEIMISFQQN